MSRLFGHVARVFLERNTVSPAGGGFKTAALPGRIIVENLRIKFKVEHSLKKHPNICDINIYNFAENTRLDVERKPLKVILEAGYNGDFRALFAGDLRFAMTELEDVTYNTLLQLGEGDRAFTQARVSRSYRAGATYREVLADTAESMGLGLPGYLGNDPGLDAVFGAGKVSHGKSRDELTKLLKPLGYEWSIQNEQLVILKDNQTKPGEVIPIGTAQGMIGTPQFGSPPRSGKPPHIKIKMLLYPELRPGQMIDLDSRFKKGLFRIEKVVHEGDTHSGSMWHTELEIKPATGSNTNEPDSLEQSGDEAIQEQNQASNNQDQ